MSAHRKTATKVFVKKEAVEPFTVKHASGTISKKKKITGESFVVTKAQPDVTIVRCAIAQLTILPKPLRLKHHIIATIETWSDGIVAARLPIAALYGEAETDTEALYKLGEAIYDFAKEVRDILKRGPIGGALLDYWTALQELVEVPHEMV